MVAASTSIERSLVGRDDELVMVEAALRQGRGGALLEGEPGIGKTALWIAGTEMARDRGACVLESRPGEAERRLSFSALDDLLSNELGEVLPHIPSPRRRALEVALLRADDPDAAPDPRGVSVAVLEFVRWLARDRPVVVAIDDLQWLDPGSARVLTFALRRLEPGDAAVLATRRAGPDPTPEPLLRTIDERSVTRLTLRPLEITAIETIIRQQLGVRLSRPGRRQVFELSGATRCSRSSWRGRTAPSRHGRRVPSCRTGWRRRSAIALVRSRRRFGRSSVRPRSRSSRRWGSSRR